MKYWLTIAWFWILCLCLGLHMQMLNVSELKSEVRVLQEQYKSVEIRVSGNYKTYNNFKSIKPKVTK